MTCPIFLIGFMASGKSAVGRSLARKLSRPLVDLDRKIEKRTGKRIHEIIQLQGEDAFRMLESDELRAAASQPNAIVATGGGVVLRPENRTLMDRCGATIWLDLPFDECWRRIHRDRKVRPLAPNRDSAELRWIERQDLYAECKLRIELSGQESTAAITQMIIEKLDVLSAEC